MLTVLIVTDYILFLGCGNLDANDVGPNSLQIVAFSVDQYFLKVMAYWFVHFVCYCSPNKYLK